MILFSSVLPLNVHAADDGSASNICAKYYSIFNEPGRETAIKDTLLKEQYYLLSIFHSYWPIPNNLIIEDDSGNLVFRTPYPGTDGQAHGVSPTKMMPPESSISLGPNDSIYDEKYATRFGWERYKALTANGLTVNMYQVKYPGNFTDCIILINDKQHELSLVNYSLERVKEMYQIFLHFLKERNRSDPDAPLSSNQGQVLKYQFPRYAVFSGQNTHP
ncbi:MAG: hypothetical protein ACRETA_07975 [Gammaproteobacteria bacterium]